MTPTEKAERALNARIEQFQNKLRESESEAARRSLIHGIVVFVGLGEAISAHVRAVGDYAKERFAQRKGDQAALTAEHDELLRVGTELLGKFKADPTNRDLHKELERVQSKMVQVQKNVRRGANALQRELAPSLALIDRLADGIRRLCEAADKEGLQRATKLLLGCVQDFYRAHPTSVAGMIDAASWEKSAASAIAEATDFYDAQARAGYQALLALEVMTMAQSPDAPQTPEDASQRANASVAQRLTTIASRFTA